MSNAFLTELDAVNEMLASIGEQPVNDLAVQLPADALLAKTLLDRTSLRVQSLGWIFNTEEQVEFVADGSGEVPLATNIIRVDAAVGDHTGSDFIIKQRKLYDRCTNSFDLGSGKTITLTVIYFHDFADLPAEAQAYIVARAARILQSRLVGSATLDRQLRAEEALAKVEIETMETEQADYNVLRSPAAKRVLVGRISPLNRMSTQ